MNTVASACKAVLPNQQIRIQNWAVGMSPSRGVLPDVRHHDDIGRQRQIERQARNQSDRL